MILIIDNYDSFVYNLAQYIGELRGEPSVYRNDAISLADIDKLNPSHIIISPGPCTPLEAGVSNGVIKKYAGLIPILGVCLGHQCIGHVFGGRVEQALQPVHGKDSLVHHDGQFIYKGLPNPLRAGRYHSLVVARQGLPSALQVTATTADGVIMGLRHHRYAVEGVQFHPESIMTSGGHSIIENFLSIKKGVLAAGDDRKNIS
ncbi:MAG: aminodeoxychorismate/anthranilate synthase component II [Chloroflexi bacterium]|nr:aminodeoxychorismate/anthranilate synthase component II [Chloroflexota bacterium]